MPRKRKSKKTNNNNINNLNSNKNSNNKSGPDVKVTTNQNPQKNQNINSINVRNPKPKIPPLILNTSNNSNNKKNINIRNDIIDNTKHKNSPIKMPKNTYIQKRTPSCPAMILQDLLREYQMLAVMTCRLNNKYMFVITKSNNDEEKTDNDVHDLMLDQCIIYQNLRDFVTLKYQARAFFLDIYERQRSYSQALEDFNRNNNSNISSKVNIYNLSPRNQQNIVRSIQTNFEMSNNYRIRDLNFFVAKVRNSLAHHSFIVNNNSVVVEDRLCTPAFRGKCGLYEFFVLLHTWFKFFCETLKFWAKTYPEIDFI